MISCCEHSLINRNEKHFFQVERIIGSKPCQKYLKKNLIIQTLFSFIAFFRCQLENEIVCILSLFF